MNVITPKVEEPLSTKEVIMYDTGAKQTVVCDLSLLTNVTDCSILVSCAGLHQTMATKTGDLVLQGFGLNITIRDVLFIPNFEFNLINPVMFAKHDHTVSHDDFSMWLTSKKDGKIHTIASVDEENGTLFWGYKNLTPLIENREELTKYLNPSKDNANIVLLFAMLGSINYGEVANCYGEKDVIYYHLITSHMSHEGLKALSKLGVIPYKPQKNDEQRIRECKICRDANLQATPHRKRHQSAARKHERVHSDTMGPITCTKGRNIYITTLIDECTRYTEIIILENKSIAEPLLRKLKVWNSRDSTYPIRYFRCDNASEMPTDEQLASLGIEKDPISSYSPQQNGLAESINKVITRYTKRIIGHFKQYNYLPILPFILEHAVYIMNRLKPRRMETLPIKAYNDEDTELSLFKQFGTDVIVLLGSAQEARGADTEYNKFNKTADGIYLGHHGKAGYKILFDKGKILYTNNVSFGNSNDNLIRYLQMCDTMDFEKIEEQNDLTRQMENITNIKSTLEQPLTRKTEIIKDVKAMMEQLHLLDEIDSVDTVSDAIVTGLPNVLTTLEPPEEDGLCTQHSELIFHPTKGENQSTEISEGCPETGIDGEQRDLSSRGEESWDLHSVSADATDLENLPIGHLAEREPHPPQEIVTDILGTHITATEGTGLVPHAPLTSDCRGPIDDLGDASYGESPDAVNYEVIVTTPVPSSTNSDIPPDAMEIDCLPTDENGGDLPQLITKTHGISQERRGVPRDKCLGAETPHQKSSGPIGEKDTNADLSYSSPVGQNLPAESHITTKSGRIVRRPIRYRDRVLINLVRQANHIADSRSERERYAIAEEAEMEKFKKHEVYDVRKTPDGVTAIPTTWVRTRKDDDLKGAVFKARCVVQGFRQEEGRHYNKHRILSPVIDLLTVRLMTAVATEKNYSIHHLDIQLAYLNAPLPEHERIYALPPPGYETPEGYSWLLKKSVYGMKQSGYEWFVCLEEKLKSIGFVPSSYSETLFVRDTKKGRIIIALYVDDLFLMSSQDEAMVEFKEQLKKFFELKDFGEISEYLGIEFKKTECGYSLSQEKYLTRLVELFEKYSLPKSKIPIKVDYKGYGSNNNPADDRYFITPVDNTPKLRGKMKTLYESGVGSLGWASNNTRPDLAFAVSCLGSKSSDPSEMNFSQLLHCIGYVKTTLLRKLIYSAKNKEHEDEGFEIKTFSDASFAPEDDVKLVSGLAIYVNGNLVDWLSKKQKNITKSTAAAELIALSIAEDRTMQARNILMDIGYEVYKTTLLEDNTAVISCCHNKSISHSRKMVDIKMKEIRERLAEGIYTLEYVNTEINTADMCTKALPEIKYESMVSRLLFVEE